ncbi:hypothetical protein [Thermococcus stetteri]|uniref:hypothetical protein n=1 Tax=Thermococcus stetteri TaxID=49900 RepID=UPI001FD7363B|nr:hypothetical protein [Thermococcus stetteri]
MYYIVLGLGINRGAIPGLGPQAFFWFLYALTGFLLYRALKKSRGLEVERTAAPPLRKLVVLSAVWIISGVAFSTLELFIYELKYLIITLLCLFGSVIGLMGFFRSSRWALAG